MQTIQEQQQAFEAELNKKVTKWQNETLFPGEALPINFPDMVRTCFRFNSSFDLRMTAEHYKELTEMTEGYTYTDISEIGLVLKKRNAYELSMDIDQFNDFQMGVENMVREMLKRSTEQKESLAKKLMVMAKVEKNVPQSHKTVKFPTATA